MKDMLTVAKQKDFDVFNALDLMDNAEFLKVTFESKVPYEAFKLYDAIYM